MALAVSGDRSTALGLALGESAYLFAVARGSGAVDGVPVAASALERLRDQAQRRFSQERFRRSLAHAESATTALLTLVGRVNAELFARGAGHDDRVNARCSLTAVLVVGRRAVVAHAGSTAAYLARAGYVVALTQDDALREGAAPVLMRAFGTQAQLDASVCGFTFNDGDTLALSGRRLRGEEDRRRLSDALRAGEDSYEDGVLLVRYAGDESAPEPARQRSPLAVRVAVSLGALASLILSLLCVR